MSGLKGTGRWFKFPKILGGGTWEAHSVRDGKGIFLLDDSLSNGLEIYLTSLTEVPNPHPVEPLEPGVYVIDNHVVARVAPVTDSDHVRPWRWWEAGPSRETRYSISRRTAFQSMWEALAKPGSKIVRLVPEESGPVGKEASSVKVEAADSWRGSVGTFKTSQLTVSFMAMADRVLTVAGGYATDTRDLALLGKTIIERFPDLNVQLNLIDEVLSDHPDSMLSVKDDGKWRWQCAGSGCKYRSNDKFDTREEARTGWLVHLAEKINVFLWEARECQSS